MPGLGGLSRGVLPSAGRAFLAIWERPVEVGVNAVLIVLFGMAWSMEFRTLLVHSDVVAVESAADLEHRIAYDYAGEANYAGLSMLSLEVRDRSAVNEARIFDLSISPASVFREQDSFRVMMSGLGYSDCVAVVDQGRGEFGPYTRSFSVNGGAAFVPTEVSGLAAKSACASREPNSISILSIPGPLESVPEPAPMPGIPPQPTNVQGL